MQNNGAVKIVTSEDGSHTLYNSTLNETYHSIHGAKTESLHVFINNGLKLIFAKNIAILEVGMGTGLNVLLTYLHQKKHAEIKNISYHTLELHPLSQHTVDALNYGETLSEDENAFFKHIHAADWNKETMLSPTFKIHKIQADLIDYTPSYTFDLVYFDAFAPDVQPKLWTKKIFQTIFEHLNPGGVLTTYSAKGQLRRDLIEVGFRVERRPGPPGKREMIVAFKDILHD